MNKNFNYIKKEIFLLIKEYDEYNQILYKNKRLYYKIRRNSLLKEVRNFFTCQKCQEKNINIKKHYCKKCKKCNKIIIIKSYEEKYKIFCNKKCSAKFNNKKKNTITIKKQKQSLHKTYLEKIKKNEIPFRIKNISRKDIIYLKRSNLFFNFDHINKLLIKFKNNKNYHNFKNIKKNDIKLYNSINLLNNKQRKIVFKNIQKNKNKFLRERNKEKYKIELKKYKSTAELLKKDRNLYDRIIKYQKKDNDFFFKRNTKHFDKLGDLYNRCIYVLIFPEVRAAYIGLTYNYKKRIIEHQNLKNQKNYKIKKLLLKNYKILDFKLTDYLHYENAKKMEHRYINYFKKRQYHILNIAKAGSLGYFKVSK